MDNEKLDNLLNLALDSTPLEFEKSEQLRVGSEILSYEPSGTETRVWKIIAKSSGGFDWIRKRFPSVTVSPLLNGYAVLTVSQEDLPLLASQPEMEYIEKPKRLFFAVNNSRLVSCINQLQSNPTSVPDSGNASLPLWGQNILLAVIDSGIDYTHPDFRNEDGTTRIVELWDQTLDRIFSAEEINQALEQPTESLRFSLVPSRDLSGHGTHVAGICGGNGRASDGLYRGVAPLASFLIVKLGTPDPEGFPKTTELMLAVDYVLRRAKDLGQPVAINISFGNNYGSHDGTSLLETYLNDISSFWKSVIVTGTGNEGASNIHTSGNISNSQIQVIPFSVGEYQTSFGLQFWKSYADEFDIQIRTPEGRVIGPLQPSITTQRYLSGETILLIYYGSPRPYSTSQEIYVDFIPNSNYVTYGTWEIILTPKVIVNGQYDLWLPSQASLSSGTGFLTPTETTTLTIPSTASNVISVGAYNSTFDSYAPFSGRGYTRFFQQIKPDLAAPGVNITSCAPGGGYAVRSGTSMAAPFVTGSAALLMEWGIRLNNDPFLYGEKVKAYLIRGAKRTITVPGYNKFPNPIVGWGTLCTYDSIPK